MRLTDEQLLTQWFINTNQYFAHARIFKHVESTKLLLFKEMIDKEWIYYTVEDSSKEIYDLLTTKPTDDRQPTIDQTITPSR